MISDFARIERSAFISIGFHAALFGSYLALKHQKQEQNVVLTKVDFIDLKPEEAVPAAPAPAMQAPKNLADLIRMALPVFNRPKPPEPVMPKDMPLDKIKPQLKDVSMPKLDIDKKMASSQEKPLDLKLARLPQDRQLTDMDASRRPKLSDLAPMKEESKISLDAVGRVAVAREPHIQINPGRAYAPAMADMPTAKAAPAAAPAEAPAASALDLSRQFSARSSPSLPVGYSRGHAISLATAPRPAAAPVKLPPAPKAAAEEKLAKADGKPKAVEISGPLAKRKVLSSYLPAYPEWAKAQGVEADVVLRFFVGPDGSVLGKMSVERTSGYPKLDKLCEEAIKKWVFAPLPGSEEAQWGFVTFRFRLK